VTDLDITRIQGFLCTKGRSQRTRYGTSKTEATQTTAFFFWALGRLWLADICSRGGWRRGNWWEVDPFRRFPFPVAPRGHPRVRIEQLLAKPQHQVTILPNKVTLCQHSRAPSKSNLEATLKLLRSVVARRARTSSRSFAKTRTSHNSIRQALRSPQNYLVGFFSFAMATSTALALEGESDALLAPLPHDWKLSADAVESSWPSWLTWKPTSDGHLRTAEQGMLKRMSPF
jgi:hypothetical protein